jgi:hypothetical protein
MSPHRLLGNAGDKLSSLQVLGRKGISEPLSMIDIFLKMIYLLPE